MSDVRGGPATNGATRDADTEPESEVEDLRVEVDLLEEENERLRDLYAATNRASYHRSALALAGLGVFAVAGAAVFPAVRTVLLALGAIGLFGGVLTYYLTPEQFVVADVSERIFDAVSTNEAALVADLGLSDDRVVLPADPVTLFIPQQSAAPLPKSNAIDGPMVATDDSRGLALTPTGDRLLSEFERTLTGGLAATPAALTTQLTDALTEGFELVDRTAADLDGDDGRLTVELYGSVYDDSFDTPPASLLAVGLAVGLETPVWVEQSPANDADFTVTCRWDPETVTSNTTDDESSEPSDSDEPQPS